MTKITRPDINVQGFASSPQSQERTTFGTETESTNLADFLTPEFLRGWGVLPVGGKPPYQWFNGAVYLISQLQAMQFQQGIPEHVASQEFHRNGLTAKNGVLYRSKTDSNTGNDPEADSANWQPQTAMVPGTKDVSDIDANGVLELTVDDGKYITLTGHGAADFEITGFGDQLPVGYEFELIIPRTLPNTGNAANALGNFTQFTHTDGIDGIDMTMNKRVVNGSPLFNQQAYPDFSDSEGNACNIDERYKFIQLSKASGGRAALTSMPKRNKGENVKGAYSLHPNGTMEVEFSIVDTNVSIEISTGNVYRTDQITKNYPIDFFSASVASIFGNAGSGQYVWFSRSSMPEVSSISYNVLASNSVTANIRTDLIAKGLWKPQV